MVSVITSLRANETNPSLLVDAALKLFDGQRVRARMQCEVDTNPHHPYGHLKRSIGDYLGGLYFDTACFDPAILRFATTIVPVEHFVMGSDAPFPLVVPNPVTFVRDALPPDAATLVLSENFDRLIGR